MTVTLDLKPEEERELREAAEQQGTTPDGFMRQALTEKMIAELRNRRVPQSLDEIKPRRLPPPGKTAMEMVYGQLETDETDEEIFRALEELS